MRKSFVLVTALALSIMLTACTVSQIQQASQLAGIVVNAIPSIVSLLGGNAGAVNAANQAKADFALAQSVLADYQKDSVNATTNLQRVNAALIDGQANLDAILAASHVAGANQQKVAAAVNLAIGVAQDIIADLPSSTGKPTLAHPAKLPKPSAVQHQFDVIFAR